MRKVLVSAAALVLVLWVGPARAQCGADYVLGNAGGSWQVNNAGGEGFGSEASSPRAVASKYCSESMRWFSTARTSHSSHDVGSVSRAVAPGILDAVQSVPRSNKSKRSM